MRHKSYLTALIAMSLIGAPVSAFAQGAGAGAAIGTAPGTGTVPPVGAPNPGSAGISSAPGGSSTTTTGMGTGGIGTGSSTNLNTGGVNQPGVPTHPCRAPSAPEHRRAACQGTILPIQVCPEESADSCRLNSLARYATGGDQMPPVSYPLPEPVSSAEVRSAISIAEPISRRESWSGR